jgi:hypothetical protein
VVARVRCAEHDTSACTTAGHDRSHRGCRACSGAHRTGRSARTDEGSEEGHDELDGEDHVDEEGDDLHHDPLQRWHPLTELHLVLARMLLASRRVPLMPDTVERNFYIYNVAVLDDDGTAIDQRPFWRELRSLPYKKRKLPVGQGGRPLADGEEPFDHHRAQVHKLIRGGCVGEFGSTKRHDLPGTRDEHEESAELELAKNQELDFVCQWLWRDFSHCTLAPNEKVASPFGMLVWEHNQFAPGFRAFESYLNRLFRGRGRFVILPSTSTDAEIWSELSKHKTFAEINLKLSRTYAEQQHAQSSGIMAWVTSYAPADYGSFEVIIRPRRGERMAERDWIRKEFERLRGLPEIEKLRVRDEEGKLIDVIQKRIQDIRMVTRLTATGKRIDPASVHAALHEVFDERKTKLAAGSGRVWSEYPKPD